MIGVVIGVTRKKTPVKATPKDQGKTVSPSSNVTPSDRGESMVIGSKPSSAPLSVKTSAVSDLIALLQKFEDLKKQLAELEADFKLGVVECDEYLAKKNALGQDLGSLMGEMDTKGIKYSL